MGLRAGDVGRWDPKSARGAICLATNARGVMGRRERPRRDGLRRDDSLFVVTILSSSSGSPEPLSSSTKALDLGSARRRAFRATEDSLLPDAAAAVDLALQLDAAAGVGLDRAAAFFHCSDFHFSSAFSRSFLSCSFLALSCLS